MLMLRGGGPLARIAARLFAQLASALAVEPASGVRSTGRLARGAAIDRPAFVDTQADWRRI
jgi:hypothetical protein